MDGFARRLISFMPPFLAHVAGGLLLDATRTRNTRRLLRHMGLLVRGGEEVCEGVEGDGFPPCVAILLPSLLSAMRKHCPMHFSSSRNLEIYSAITTFFQLQVTAIHLTSQTCRPKLRYIAVLSANLHLSACPIQLGHNNQSVIYRFLLLQHEHKRILQG
ncbi:hypothetical protein BDW72DRAFT_149227 [Aspergillus terricola var. indicus]